MRPQVTMTNAGRRSSAPQCPSGRTRTKATVFLVARTQPIGKLPRLPAMRMQERTFYSGHSFRRHVPIGAQRGRHESIQQTAWLRQNYLRA
jgi:hypothetical protein